MTINITFSDKTVRVAVELNGAIASAITELPQRTWVGLTLNELDDFEKSSLNRQALCCAIEAKLKEKNT